MGRSGLGRGDWLRAGRLALLKGGAAGVRIERMAEDLGVTRGSFYWHFADRDELLEALLKEWEDELDEVQAMLPPLEDPAAVGELTVFLAPRVSASEVGEAPSDAAIFAWAATDPDVAARVNAAEARRLDHIRRLVGDDDLGEFLYLSYLGFIMRRRRSPAAAEFFPRLSDLLVRTAMTLAVPGPGAVVAGRDG
jgi:AcrR family transcriptional regulator